MVANLPPSRADSFRWLLRKEWRELMASRAWWVTLALTGPIVGLSFISAVRVYGELSGVGGTSAGVGEAFSPLVGIFGPTFGAYEILALFFLPFVAIRLVGGDRQTGAQKLELQQPLSTAWLMAAKTIVLMVAWAIAGLGAVVATVLWIAYGGHIHTPEIVSLVLGFFLNAGLAIALAAAAAAVTEHPSTAAIITLGITVATWIVSFVAAIHGGLWDVAAGYTPSAMLSTFQRGLIRVDVILAAVTLAAAGLAIAAIWMRIGQTVKRRLVESLIAGAAAAAIVVAGTWLRLDWDVSENRQNSFSEAETEALRSITSRLTIEPHLAPEDGRRAELERVALVKLRRTMPALTVRYVSNTTVGMFEQTAPGYGEIFYELDGRRTSSRIVTAEGVLEAIFDVAQVTPGAEIEAPYRGYPLAARPAGAPLIFCVLWPATIGGIGTFVLRRHA